MEKIKTEYDLRMQFKHDTGKFHIGMDEIDEYTQAKFQSYDQDPIGAYAQWLEIQLLQALK